MANPLVVQAAWRFRRPLLLTGGALLVVLAMPVIAVIAALGGIGSGYGPSDIAVADIPAEYLPLYQRAASTYDLDWAVLAAVGKVECDHGRNRDDGCRPYTANSAGAVGPMQFLPPTWADGHTIGETRVAIPPVSDGAGYATDGDGDGVADIWNPADAIAGAARMLKANGAPRDYRRALFAYNHASWYVDMVLRQAADYRGALEHGGRGAAGIEAFANGFLGTAYVWGGNHGRSLADMQASQPSRQPGLDGRLGYFDCSSLVSWAYAKRVGIYVGDTTDQQWAYALTTPGASRGSTVPAGGLRPGDLVFFHSFGHVGIYLGGDRFIHSPHTGDDVKVSQFSTYGGFDGWVRYDQVAGRPAGGTR